jgi:hypothetical protein
MGEALHNPVEAGNGQLRDPFLRCIRRQLCYFTAYCMHVSRTRSAASSDGPWFPESCWMHTP